MLVRYGIYNKKHRFKNFANSQLELLDYKCVFSAYGSIDM